MTRKECFDKYFAIVTADGTRSQSIKGAARDEQLLPLSCIPLLAMDNHGYSYPVIVEPSEYRDHRPVLQIVGAPSGWFLSDLLPRGTSSDRIALDHGQGWYCVNFTAVLDAVVAAGLDRGQP